MRHRSDLLTGRSFTTTYDRTDIPVWEPLEGFARLVWEMPDLPNFHPGEMGYVAGVRNKRMGIRIHLYKHIDTRCYLNLDDAGHAYAYQPHDDELVRLDRPDYSGRYRQYRTAADAVSNLRLWKFESVGLFRSFPPEQWPGHDF